MFAQPALSIITPVSIDHQHYLGDDLKSIAFEKAGILKEDTPAIIGLQESETLAVIEARARDLGAALSLAGREWSVMESNSGITFRDQSGEQELPLPNLAGAHQVDNAGVALAALAALPQFDVKQDARALGLRRAQWPARLQRLERGALGRRLPEGAELWLDGGHNPAAGAALANAMADMAETRPLYLVVGMLANKDARGFLEPLAKKAAGLIALPVPGGSACLAPGELAGAARDLCVECSTANDIAEALDKIAAESHAAPPRVLICGSLYLAGAVLRENEK